MPHAPSCCTNYVTLWFSARSLMRPVPPRSAPHKVLPRLTSPAHATDSFPAFSRFPAFSSLSVFHSVPLKCFSMHICRFQIGFLGNNFEHFRQNVFIFMQKSTRKRAAEVPNGNYSKLQQWMSSTNCHNLRILCKV